MSQSGTVKVQSLHSQSKTNQSNHVSVVKTNRKIDEFFSFSNSKSHSSLISSGVKTSTTNNDKPKQDNKPATYLNKKKERNQLDSKPKKAIKPVKEKKNKVICSICLDGGDLLLCDQCPNSFHIACLKINEDDLPEGNWYCNDCLVAKERKICKKTLKRKDKKLIKTKGNNNNIKINKDKQKPELPLSLMKSFIKGSHKENINRNIINETMEEPISSIDANYKKDKVKTDKDIPLKVLNTFSKEEQIVLHKYFFKHKESLNDNVLNSDESIKQLCYNILTKKQLSKYPINDKELYSNSILHSLPDSCFKKPEGSLITLIKSLDISPLLKIWDFIQSFSFLTSIAPFPPEYLYTVLKNSQKTTSEIPLITEVYSFFIYILVKEVQETDLTNLQPESEMMMINIICDNNNIKEFIKHSWPELIKLFVQNDSETLLSKLPPSQDMISFIRLLSYENHITLLNYLLNKAIETEYLRDIIKEGQENRDELKKTKRDYEEELKIKQSRKKELERQEKYTQPLKRIEELKKKIETLNEDNAQLSRKSIASLRKSIEHQIEEFKSVIKEAEIIKGEEIDIINHIERLNKEVMNIGVIDKKCLGTDAMDNKYYLFPWVNDRIFIKRKQCNNWSYLSSIKEVTDLIDSLSDKGIKESNLKKKLLRNYSQRLSLSKNTIKELTIDQVYYNALNWNNKHKAFENDIVLPSINDTEDQIIDINQDNVITKIEPNNRLSIEYENSLHEEIIKKMNLIEELMTEYLSFEGKQWESFDTRSNIKSWLCCIKSIDEYKNTITLWANRSKYPYHTNVTNRNRVQSKLIEDTDEYNDYYSLIDSNGSLSYATINPTLQLSNKTKFWSKEYEQLGLEIIFNDYLKNVTSFPQLFFILYFFESLYNELTKQRDFLQKKSDIVKVNVNNYINSCVYKPTEVNVINESQNKDNGGNVKSRLRKHLIKKDPMHSNNRNKGRERQWDETCMFCGEFGDLICCEECSNVTHLYCAEMKKVPDTWLCNNCLDKVKSKRLTRSSHRYFK